MLEKESGSAGGIEVGIGAGEVLAVFQMAEPIQRGIIPPGRSAVPFTGTIFCCWIWRACIPIPVLDSFGCVCFRRKEYKKSIEARFYPCIFSFVQ